MHRAIRRMLGDFIQLNATENIQPLLTYEMAISYGSAKQKRHRHIWQTHRMVQDERRHPWEIWGLTELAKMKRQRKFWQGDLGRSHSRSKVTGM